MENGTGGYGKIAVLGSTGSIGTQALEICETLGIKVMALTARSNIKLLEQQARLHRPAVVCVEDERLAASLRISLADTPVRVLSGREALCETAALPGADTVLCAVVGVAGLPPVLAAAKAGKTIALANKESLVAGGALVTKAVKDGGATLLPVDSEHCAIFQCMCAGLRQDVSGVVLTASGGPFFGWTDERLADVTPEQALRHPNWKMGDKITVDSATLMNKGLEVIEAMWLFSLSPDDIEVVVHRQSIVHSAVKFADGSTIAQMGTPDMRTAIQYALTYPHRLPVAGVPLLSLTGVGALTFEAPDRNTFGCLAACELAAKKGGLYPAAVNAAGEAAVELFLEGRIPFLEIREIVLDTLESFRAPGGVTLESVLGTGELVRERVRSKY